MLSNRSYEGIASKQPLSPVVQDGSMRAASAAERPSPWPSPPLSSELHDSNRLTDFLLCPPWIHPKVTFHLWTRDLGAGVFCARSSRPSALPITNGDRRCDAEDLTTKSYIAVDDPRTFLSGHDALTVILVHESSINVSVGGVAAVSTRRKCVKFPRSIWRSCRALLVF